MYPNLVRLSATSEAIPGSEAKILLLIARCEAGAPLFWSDDPPLPDRVGYRGLQTATGEPWMRALVEVLPTGERVVEEKPDRRRRRRRPPLSAEARAAEAARKRRSRARLAAIRRGTPAG